MVEPEGLYFALFLLACIERFKRLHPASLLLQRSPFGWTTARPFVYPGDGSWGWRWAGLAPLSGLSFLLGPASPARRVSLRDIRSHIAQIDQALRPLRLPVLLLALWIVIGMPALAFRLGARPALVPIALALLLLDLAVAAAVWTVLPRLPRRTGVPGKWACLKYAVYPPAALMAPVELMWPLLQDIPPVTAVLATCGPDTPVALVRTEWARLSHTLENRPNEEAVQHLRQDCREAGLTWSAVTAAPSTRDAQANSYCPRCHTQFRLDPNACPDCDGIRTIPFDSVKGAR